jgi:alpha-aminoadipate carrier protein LysW
MSTNTSNETLNASCPECEGLISFDRPPLSGQIATCSDCGAELEVISRDPIKLELAPEVEEDWGE